MFGVEAARGPYLGRESLHRGDRIEAAVEDGLLKVAQEIGGRDRGGAGGGEAQDTAVVRPLRHSLAGGARRGALRPEQSSANGERGCEKLGFNKRCRVMICDKISCSNCNQDKYVDV